MSVDKILNRLEKVRRTSPGRWIAKCPAHADKAPSLSIAVGEDMRSLIHCHAGCTAEAVMSAIGLTMADLFDGPVSHHKPPVRQPWSWGDVMPATLLPLLVAFQYLTKVHRGETLTKAQQAELWQCIVRVGSTISLIDGKRQLTQAEMHRYSRIAERLLNESEAEREIALTSGGDH